MYIYGASNECVGVGYTGVIVATHPRGDLAHVVYMDHKHPLYLVPRSFFLVSPAERRYMSKSEYNKRTTSPFSNGTNVDFQVVEGTNVVKWIFKRPSVLDIDFSGGGAPFLFCPGVTSGNALWTRKFGDITEWMGSDSDAIAKKLESLETNVPLTVCLKLYVDFGEFEDADFVPVKGFWPEYQIRFHDVWLAPPDSLHQIVEDAPWNGGTSTGLGVEAKADAEGTKLVKKIPSQSAASPPASTSDSGLGSSSSSTAKSQSSMARAAICMLAQDEKARVLLEKTGLLAEFNRVLAEEKIAGSC